MKIMKTVHIIPQNHHPWNVRLPMYDTEGNKHIVMRDNLFNCRPPSPTHSPEGKEISITVY